MTKNTLHIITYSCKSVIFLFLLLIPFLMCSQNTSNREERVTIQNKFSLKAIKAYQKQGDSKVIDFYNYLNILSAKSTSDSLAVETKNVIRQLFNETNSTVVDVTQKQTTFIPLETLMQKITQKGYVFTCNAMEHSIVAQDYWSTKYMLKVVNNDITYEWQLLQTVYFKPILKTFGSKSRLVWSLWLGPIETY